MSKTIIEKRFEELDNSFEADQLRSIEYIISESKKTGVSIEEIRKKNLSYISFLDRLYEKASQELRYLNKNYFGTPYHNWATGKVYNLKGRIRKVKEFLLGETANK